MGLSAESIKFAKARSLKFESLKKPGSPFVDGDDREDLDSRSLARMISLREIPRRGTEKERGDDLASRDLA